MPPAIHDQSGTGLFCGINVNRDNGKGCEDVVDDLRNRHSLVRQTVCVFALQETDNWIVSEMCVLRLE